MADAIFRGVRDYMVDNPPPGSFLAWRKRGGDGELITYVIEPGDTLSGIASRYRISFASLKKVNGLRSDMIKIGQVLKIPAS